MVSVVFFALHREQLLLLDQLINQSLLSCELLFDFFVVLLQVFNFVLQLVDQLALLSHRLLELRQ